VASTLNVQHLESVGDAVATIRGAAVLHVVAAPAATT
jgi:K+-sensing histidine kinase KdpD